MPSVCAGSFAPGVVCTSSSVGIFVPFLIDGDSTTTAMVVSRRRWLECCAGVTAGRLVIRALIPVGPSSSSKSKLITS
jgi:hypothetical protein